MTTHVITERKSPTHIIIMCSCGWHFQISRKQNAWARASKIKAAINRHRFAEKLK